MLLKAAVSAVMAPVVITTSRLSGTQGDTNIAKISK